MILTRWKRHTWDLQKAPPTGPAALHSFQIRNAARDDDRAVQELIFNTLLSEFGWGERVKGIRAMLEEQIEAAFERNPPSALVAKHGLRIIAVSLLAPDPDAENHLLTGPCVLSEYRNRGIGTALLLESLKLLHAAGITKVHGICKEASPAGKFVYRKFGSTSEMYQYEPTVIAHSRGN